MLFQFHMVIRESASVFVCMGVSVRECVCVWMTGLGGGWYPCARALVTFYAQSMARHSILC